jgi:hypothetical protein
MAKDQEGWWQYLQRARTKLAAVGEPFRTTEDIEQERREFRSGADRIESLYRQIQHEPE